MLSVRRIIFCLSIFNLYTCFSVFAQEENPEDTVIVNPEDLPTYRRDRYGDPFSEYRSPSPFLLNKPSSINLDISLDTSGNFYNISEKFGPYDYRTESKIPYDLYREYKERQMIKDYWKTISTSKDGGDEITGEGLAIPPIQLGRFAQRLFGGDQVTIQPNGSVVLDFGGLWQRVDNPSLPIRQQRNGGFNFDQQISMALSGKIGEKLSVNANFDTKNTFQFEQQYNVSYTAFDEDIIQEVQLGNVSFPSRNSLITGAQNLFGFTTKMRFGKLTLNTVISNQRGSTETITIKNGAQAREFEIRGDQYDLNRHFFLAQFFRENFERSFNSLPAITSGVVVTRVELYVTNRNNNTQTLRNIAAYMDLGEGRPFNTGLIPEPNPVNAASNTANNLFESLINDAEARIADNTSRVMESNFGFSKGVDFELLRSARKLEEREYILNPQLGFVSLITPLRPDEILAVSFEYTYNGQVYRVGELTEDYQSLDDDAVIFMKMLSPSTIRTDLPVWDLMMKNIYSLQTNQLTRDNFQLRVIYRDDLTGIDNPSLHEGGDNIRNIPLVNILGVDELNPQNERQPDGNFDYIEGLTVESRTGRIMFTKLEPFGSHIATFFDPNSELQLINKYVFQELYDGTQADATLNTTLNKYFLRGSFQSGNSNEIILPGINISEGSVVVRAGNTILNEGTDYTVDYNFGRVRILNEGVSNSGKEIKIQYERADLFSFQQRSLMGFDAEYQFSKDIRFTGTFLHLNERPTISRVAVGTEPTRNTIWGLGVDYRSESRLLTRIIDKIPFLSTKEQSNVALKAEFAHIIPGAPGLLVGDKGTSYIDDFEQAEVPYDLTRSPQSWVLGSTPQLVLDEFNLTDSLDYNYRRAKLAWYSIDNAFYFGAGPRGRPDNLTEEDLENNYVRLIGFDEVFPNRQRGQIAQNEISFDLAYYPNERGAYNYNTDLNPDGTLRNPEDNFASITRAITHDIDFDNINIQYIEFWLMDPFTQDRSITGASNTNTGGQLYFNLGSISEDIIPDDRHFFENGIPITTEEEAPSETIWGKVPNKQFLTNAFDVGPGAREIQDIGFDGLNNTEELEKFDQPFISQLPGVLNPDAREAILNDPSADDFRYYLDPFYDEIDAGVLERYKQFNGMERNSPENAGATFTPSSYQTPDNEDLNRDQTISDIEQYFQYRVDLNPGMGVGTNPYIVDEVVGDNNTTWYQFRIPLRDLGLENINDINGFKSIRFIRMFLTGWNDPVVLRMVQFQMVGAQWRPFTESLLGPEFKELPDSDNTEFTVSSVNIEENGQEVAGENSFPYDLPPGFQRDFDITSTVNRQLNEQSIQLCVEDLQDEDARAVFKNYGLDLVFYKRLKMEIHAHALDQQTGDEDLRAFIRLGTDFQQNYYEIEIPLTLTREGDFSREALWPRENEIDIAIEELYKLKSARNKAGANVAIPYPAGNEPNLGRYRISVVGNPDLSSVQTAMLGIRNPSTPDRQSKSACVWMNELRVSEFDRTPGWATNISLNTKLADFAMVNASLRYNSVGFGGIQDRVSDRARSSTLDYDLSANINLDKILLGKLGLTLPLFVSYEKSTTEPFFDPLDPDVPLDIALDAFNDPGERQRYRDLVRDISERRSINLTNVRKTKLNKEAKSHLWDIENLSLSAAYSDAFVRNINTESMETRQWRLGAVYGFQNKAKAIEPFKNSDGLKSPWLQLIKDINFNLLPTSIAVRGDLVRDFRRTQLRNQDLTTNGFLPNFEKSFVFNRAYTMNWAISKNLGLDYNARANAIIDEPAGELDEEAREEIRDNLRDFGRMKAFSQTIGANYRLPLDKFPLTKWLEADTRYSTTFDWAAGTLGIADSLGNTMRNNTNFTVNGKVDLNKIYNGIPFLKKINNTAPRGRGRQKNPLEDKKASLEQQVVLLEAKQKRKDEKAAKKKIKYLEKLAKGDSLLLDSLLQLPAEAIKTKKEIKVENKRIKQLEKIAKGDSLLLDSLLNLPPDAEVEGIKQKGIPRKIAKVNKKILAIDERIAKKKQVEKPKEFKALKGVAGLLLSVKNVNATYSETSGTTLPGFMRTPSLFGFDNEWESPGLPFILGSQDPGILNEGAERGWLSVSPFQNNPFLQNRQRNLNFRANAEPIKDFKIQLDAKRTITDNYSENFRTFFDENGVLALDANGNPDFARQTPVRTGSYSMSFFTMQTAFSRDDENNRSSVFDEFVRNRDVILERLNALNPNSGVEYDTNSQDVLIPAFRAAYTKGDASKTKLSAFLDIPIPNWRVTYSGLSKIPAFKEIFRSVSITHGYSSDYAVGSYSSSLFYSDRPDLLGLSVGAGDIAFANADTSNIAQPVLIVNQLTISEQFSPLIGINVRTKSDITIKVDYKKRRDLALNLTNSEVTELKSNDITLDLGMTKAGMKVPFRIRGAYKTLENDVTMRMAFTVRDTKTIQRKINDAPTVTQGNVNIQFRPTVSYQLNKQANLQFYFERSINEPRVSNSFKRTTTSFGIQVRYALTQ
ncbi:MAG: cell surface protein SprA [Bacteroidota bacterium]